MCRQSSECESTQPLMPLTRASEAAHLYQALVVNRCNPLLAMVAANYINCRTGGNQNTQSVQPFHLRRLAILLTYGV